MPAVPTFSSEMSTSPRNTSPVRLPTPPTVNHAQAENLVPKSTLPEPPSVPAPSRPTWATIDDDELEDVDSGRSAEQELGIRGMSDEMTDAVGGLMQMAGGAVSAGPAGGIPNEEEEDELVVDPEEESIVSAGPVGRGRGRGRGRGATATGSGRGRKKADGTAAPKKSRKSAVKPFVTSSALTPTSTLSVYTPGEEGQVPLELMEIDEIADDDAMSTITASTALDVPGASSSTAPKKRRGGKAGTGTGRGKKKIDPELGNDDPEGSMPGTPVSTGKTSVRRKKVAPPPSNSGDPNGQGPGGVTRNQPQYHVMKKDDGEMCGRADIQVRYGFLNLARFSFAADSLDLAVRLSRGHLQRPRQSVLGASDPGTPTTPVIRDHAYFR